MKNKNLLIGIGVAVAVYYFYSKSQNKKIQTIENTDMKLNEPNSLIEEKKDLGNGLSVVYDIANCNKTTKKCPIMRVVKQDGDTFTSWYSENNKYFKRVESPLAPKGGKNVTEITEQQYIDEAISKVPF